MEHSRRCHRDTTLSKQKICAGNIECLGGHYKFIGTPDSGAGVYWKIQQH